MRAKDEFKMVGRACSASYQGEHVNTEGWSYSASEAAARTAEVYTSTFCVYTI